MESSGGVEQEIYFSTVKKRWYVKYSYDLCAFCHKSESVDNLRRGTVQCL